MNIKVLAVTFLLAALSAALAANAVELRGSISAQGDTVHVEFTGVNDWNYDLKKDKNAHELYIDPIHQSLISQLSKFKNEFIKEVVVDRNGPDGKFIVRFIPTSADIEVFDYLTDQPSRLILDFYVNPNIKKATTAAAVSEPKPKSTSTKKETDTSVASKDAARNPAATDQVVIAQNEAAPPMRAGIFDGADPGFDRFSIKDYEIKEDSIIRSKNNYYIPFPSLRAQSELWAQVQHAPAVYEIKPENNEENKMARLLLSLFEKKRFNVYLRTLDFFQRKYPQSKYNEVIEFVSADVHLEMWKETGSSKSYDTAQLQYAKLINKYPDNPLSLRLSLKRGYLSLEKGDTLSAIQLFQTHLDNTTYAKNLLSRDLAKIGKAQAYTRLNQYDSALKELDEVAKYGSDKNLQIEAKFRRGDVYIQKADANAQTKNTQKEAMETAIKEYAGAIRSHKEAVALYPNAVFNTAESQFWLEDRLKSLEGYKEFVMKFPNHPHAPFAMTRIGELLEILGADQSKVMGAYLETYFRFGESPSAVIARMRMLSTRMKGMKPKELENSIQQIAELGSRVDLPNMKQFATILVSDGLRSRGAYDQASKSLIDYYQQNPTTVDKNLFSKRIVSNINSQIGAALDRNDFISALKTHAKYSDTWLKGSKRLDTSFYVGQAFEKAGVENEADRYYRDVLNRTYAIKGTPKEKELTLLEELPSLDRLNLRLASVAVSKKQFKDAYEYIRAIKQPENLNDDEQIERVELAVNVLEQKGENESSIRYLTELLKYWKGQPAKVAGPYLKLAELERRLGKTDSALESLDKISQMEKDSSAVDKDIHFKSLQMKAEILSAASKKKELIPVYEDMLSKYEESRPLGSIRYKLGEIYFKQGDLQKAGQVWKDFKGEKSGFWANLADEQMKNSKWGEEYKKYIQRIPAMATEE